MLAEDVEPAHVSPWGEFGLALGHGHVDAACLSRLLVDEFCEPYEMLVDFDVLPSLALAAAVAAAAVEAAAAAAAPAAAATATATATATALVAATAPAPELSAKAAETREA